MTYLEVLNLQQRRVRNNDGSNFVLICQVERRPSTIAVSQSGNLGDATCLEGSKDLADPGFRNIGTVRSEPLHEVKVRSRVESTGRAWLVENIRNNDLEAVASVVVREKLIDRKRMSAELATNDEDHDQVGRWTNLMVDKLDAKDIRDVEDSLIFRIVDGRSRNVRLYAVILFPLACI